MTLGSDPAGADPVGVPRANEFAGNTSAFSLDIGRRTTSALVWTSASRIFQVVVQFVVTVVLTRLLVPADFGLVGLITVFTGFAAVLTDFGLTGALIQRPQLTDEHLSSAFWLNMGSGVALAGITAAVAPLISRFYGLPRLTLLTAVFGANFVLIAVGAVQAALLARSMSFRRVAVIENAASVCGAGVGIAMAALGAGVWALVVFVLVGSGARSTFLWLQSEWHPKAAVHTGAIRDLWSFSINLTGFNLVNYWSRNADNLLIGRFVGAAALGLYTRAYSTMLMPLGQVATVTSRVMFPALSRLQHDPPRVRGIYLRSLTLISMVAFPMVVGLFVAARPFVLALFGQKWHAVIPILQILCGAALFQSIGTTTGWIFQSQGRTDWMLRWGLASSALIVGSFAIGVHWGAEGVAASYTIVTTVLAYFGFAIPGKLIELRVRDVVAAVRVLLGISLAMGAIVWVVLRFGLDGARPAEQLGVAVVTGLVTYVVLVAAVARPQLLELQALIKRLRAPRVDDGVIVEDQPPSKSGATA